MKGGCRCESASTLNYFVLSKQICTFGHSNRKKKMKQILTILILWICTMSVSAQEMKTIFVNLPDSIEPLLTKVNKEDCVDFLDSGMKAVVKNRFDRSAELKVLTSDYLQMQLSDVSTLELKLLPLKDSVRVICMVKTVCASACDSDIRFFDTKWNELDASDFLKYPVEDAFYLPSDSLTDDVQELRAKADICLMKASLSADDSSLTWEYTTPLTLHKDDREKLIPLLCKEPLIMQWVEGRFE